jgi:hypothetical protein
MCYANPAKSLELAKARMTPEAWEKFEANFGHFCAYSGLEIVNWMQDEVQLYDWAKWAFFKGTGL